MKRFLFPSIFLATLITVVSAFAVSEILIPEDPGTADWIVFEYPENCDDPLPSEGIGNIIDRGTSLTLVISGDTEPEIYVSGDALTRIGPYGGLLFFRTTSETATMDLHYVNSTPETYDASALTFAGGASLEGVIPPNDSGTVTLTIRAPRRGAFPMIVELDEEEISSASGSDYLYPHGGMTIVRLNPTPYLQVSYNSFGSNIPFGSPAASYPLIRKDLMPYRFQAGSGTQEISLGTLFYTRQHQWPGKNPASYPYIPWNPGSSESDEAQKSKSLMVRATNWGAETIELDLAPYRTGFESFYMKHNRLSCENSDWPNWPWYDVIRSHGSYGTNGTFQYLWPSADLDSYDSVYEWSLVPGMTAMYWGGPFDPSLMGASYTYDWPLSRDYEPGLENRYELRIGENTFAFTWTPKEFSVQGLLYPYTGDQSMILRYDRWNPEENYYPESPDAYQGSGLVVQLVDFDLDGLPLDIAEATDIDHANASMDWAAENGSISVQAVVPLVQLSPEGDDDDDALPLNIFIYATDPLLSDLGGTAWNQVKTAVNSDTPLDTAFLAQANFSYQGTDLVALAGTDRANFFRVMGDTGRVVTQFFAVVVDGPAPSGESAVQKKDGYFLLYDGSGDGHFDASMVATIAATGSDSGSSGGCSAAGLAPLGLFLLVPLFLLRRR